MPTTAYNVDRIIDSTKQSSVEEVLNALNEIQSAVYSEDTEQVLKVNSANGMPPYLETTDGQFQYDCPSDCRRTAMIFSESWPYPYSRTRVSLPDKTYYWKGRNYYTMPVSSTDALISADTLATVTFQLNPGTTTTKYYHAYYIKPTPITDISVELTIPDHMHWRLRQIVIKMLIADQSGAFDDFEKTMERQIRKIRSELNRGAQTITGKTPIREDEMEFPISYGYGWRL